jgi:hypothetical protein
VVIEVNGIGHPDMLFDSKQPYSACLICGQVYQTHEDRQARPDTQLAFERKAARDAWRAGHSMRHSHAEHRRLQGEQAKGWDATPDAVLRLASFGIYVMGDLVGSDEHAAAGREAPRAPLTDAEGS